MPDYLRPAPGPGLKPTIKESIEQAALAEKLKNTPFRAPRRALFGGNSFYITIVVMNGLAIAAGAAWLFMRPSTPPELPVYPDSVQVQEAPAVGQPVAPEAEAAPVETPPTPAAGSPAVEKSVASAVAGKPAVAANPASKTGGLVISADMGELNRKTNEALRDGRLLGPADDNAYYWLQKMRAKDPNSAFIFIAEKDLAAKALARAKLSIRMDDIDGAARWAGLATMTRPRDPGVKELLEDIEDMRD